MNTNRTVLLCLVTLIFGGLPTAQAQFSGSFQTNTISGVASNWAGWYYIGQNSESDVLLIQSNGVFNAGSITTIGYWIQASNNAIIVTGHGSTFSSAGSLWIGWTSAGPGNSLTIRDGGLVINNAGTIGDWGESDSALVTGSGSVWSNNGPLDIGINSGTCTMQISSGGAVYSAGGDLGGSGGNNNTVWITGTGSVWNSSSSVNVGDYGSSASLLISNGGLLVAANGMLIGEQPGDTSNIVSVTQGALVVTNTAGTAVLEVRQGSLQIADSLVTVDNLLYTNAQQRFFQGAASLNTRAASLSCGTNIFTLGDAAGKTMIWNINGGVNSLICSQMVLGAALGSSGILSVAGGSLLLHGLMCVGSNEYGQGVGSVSGTGTMFRTSGIVNGYNSSGVISGTFDVLSFDTAPPMVVGHNPQSLTLGARVLEFYGVSNAVVDWQSSALTNITWLAQPVTYRLNMSTNQVTGGHVFGIDSAQGYLNPELVNGSTCWQSSNLVIGTGGTLLISNTVATIPNLVVTNGGQMTSTAGSAIVNANASGFTCQVIGTNSIWTIKGDFGIGYNGAGNSLLAGNGGVVSNANGYLGYSVNSSNNSLTVTGGGSAWKNNGNLYIGDYGAGNNLVVSNGGVVNNTFGYLGNYSNANNNSVIVVGAGSSWINANPLNMGSASFGNRLVISAGGNVADYSATVGSAPSASNNSIVVTGPGSLWNNNGYVSLLIGNGSPGNTLVVSNGGYVNCSSMGYIGSSSNSALVTDPGSTWWCGEDLYVGSPGSDCNLTIRNGATIHSTFGRVGPGASHNTILLTGPNSTWTNSYLYIGNPGTGNCVIVDSGAGMASYGGYIGGGSTDQSNRVVVTGAGSVWSCGWQLNIAGGSGNCLTVSNGGAVITPALSVFASNQLNAADAIINAGILTCAAQSANFSGACQLTTGAATVDFGTNSFFIGTVSGKTMTWTMNGGVHSLSAPQVVIGSVSGGIGQFVANNASLIFNGVLYVGSNSVGNGAGSLILSNGLLRSTGLVGGFNGSGTISGLVDVLSFSSGQPTIIANGSQSLMLGARVLEFYQVTNAVVDWENSALTNITWLQQPSIYRLNGATNAPVGAYAFGLDNPDGYLTLEMVGGQSLWRSDSLVIGNGGTLLISNVVATLQTGDQQLLVTNGGQVNCLVAPGGVSPNSSSFAIAIQGATAVWNSSGDFAVGYGGSTDALAIANGGTVFDGNGYLGYSNLAPYSAALVSDAGSTWSNRLDLFVGYASGGNQLTGTNQGVVLDRNGYIGFTASSTGNLVSIGGGALWANNGNLYPGDVGPANQLIISGGSSVIGSNGYVGFAASSSNNAVWVTDNGSIWTNRTNLYIGYGSRSNLLTIANGGAVYSGNGYVGYSGTNGNNMVLITGAASVWNNRTGVVIGNAGVGNSVVLAGGQLAASTTTILNGNLLSGCGTVTGTIQNYGTMDATCNAGTLTFLSPVSNWGTLRAEGGGILEFDAAVLNFGNTNLAGGTAIFHSVYLDFSGPTNSWSYGGDGLWTDAPKWSLGQAPAQQQAVLISNAVSKTITLNASALTIGPTSLTNYTVTLSAPMGTTNTLLLNNVGQTVPFMAANLAVLNGGRLSVSNSAVKVGLLNFGFLNTGVLTVDGILRLDSSVLDLSLGSLLMGQSTPGGMAIIANGSLSSNSVAYLGYAPGGSNCSVVVTDPGSLWNSSSSIIVGYLGRGNQLTITNGAQVNTSTLYLGLASASNLLTIAGGTLNVANSSGNGTLHVTSGTLVLNGGTLMVNSFLANNGTNGVVCFHSGWLSSGGTIFSGSPTNPPFNLPFVVGDGTNSATFNLLGGVHAFGNGLVIASNAVLTGCGTINGSVLIDGAVRTDCGGTLTFTGIVTNNGILMAVNGGVLESEGPLINNGTIDIINGGTNFHSSFINNGTILTASNVGVDQTSLIGHDVVVQIQSVVGHTYQLQFTPSLASPSWTNTSPSEAGTGGFLTFTDSGGATNLPARFYRIQVTAP